VDSRIVVKTFIKLNESGIPSFVYTTNWTNRSWLLLECGTPILLSACLRAVIVRLAVCAIGEYVNEDVMLCSWRTFYSLVCAIYDNLAAEY